MTYNKDYDRHNGDGSYTLYLNEYKWKVVCSKIFPHWFGENKVFFLHFVTWTLEHYVEYFNWKLKDVDIY